MAVDDDAVVLRLLSQVLSQAGYDVVPCAGAADATPVLEAGGVSLLVTDLNMPGESGLDLARACRARDAQLPVIILSGSIDEATVRAAEALGRVTCMNKPLDHVQLLLLVNKLVAADDPD